jgi:hypothetical protein
MAVAAVVVTGAPGVTATERATVEVMAATAGEAMAAVAAAAVAAALAAAIAATPAAVTVLAPTHGRGKHAASQVIDELLEMQLLQVTAGNHHHEMCIAAE